MSPRRHWLPMLSALALLLSSFALAPRFAAGQAVVDNIEVDKIGDDPATGTYCTAALGDCSLRQAITFANSRPATNIKNITFRNTVTGTITITDTSGTLPAILGGNTTITGRTVLGTPLIEIAASGNNRGVGIEIRSSNNTISSLIIRGFNDAAATRGGSGIYIAGNNNKVFNSYIGVNPAGDPGANFRGIRVVSGSTGNLIGYDQAAGGLANVIAGNLGIGVEVVDSSNNTIKGNYIGLVPDGTGGADLIGNGSYGIQVSSDTGASANNQIGGSTELEANIIGANSNAGILLAGTNTTTNTVRSNYIGAYVASIDVGNVGDGIRIEAGARNNTLGGGDEPLLISDNANYGVLIRGSTTTGNTIGGNTSIGLNLTEDGALPNGLHGVYITDNASNNVISGAGVLIGGNTGRGVQIDSTGSSGNRVEGAYIGAVPSPTVEGQTVTVPNAQGGVFVQNARQTTIAGATISGNTGFGIRLTGAITTTIAGNYIGLDTRRTAVAANTGPGIQVLNSGNTLIGGGSDGDRNFIAGNDGSAVVISGTTTISTTVRNNRLGVRFATPGGNYATVAAGRSDIHVSNGARQVTITDNTVAGRGVADVAGIRVEGDGTVGGGGPLSLSGTNVATVTISLNRIGWTRTSEANSIPIVGANDDGVSVSGRVQAVSVLSNTIQFNQGAAIRLNDVLTATVRGQNPIFRNGDSAILVGGESRFLTIERNIIRENGRNTSGTAEVNPDAHGVALIGPIKDARVISNTITANTGNGIFLQDNVDRATLQYNLLTQNGGPIELVGTTTYGGSGPDPDTQTTPNHDIDPPIVDLGFVNPLSLRVNQAGFIEGYVYTSTVRTESGLSPVSACVTCTIQLFAVAAAPFPIDGQGATLLQTSADPGSPTLSDFINVDPTGRFRAFIAGPLPRQLLLVATDGFGNSSEYATLPITGSIDLEGVSPLAANAAPGDTVTYTLRLRNTGTVGYTNLRVRTSGTLARWIVGTTPISNTDFALAAGAERLITVTLKLPTGPDANVAAGTVNTTTVEVTGSPPPATDAVQLVTTVLPRPVIRVTPLQSVGAGKPDTTVPHAFTIRNDGNVTVTLNLAYTTVDAAASPGVWATTLNTDTLTIGPGKDARALLSVTVPTGAIQGASATTYLTATVQPGTNPAFPSQTVVFSATTRADLNDNADLYPNLTAEGAAGGEVSLTHTVENKSNGVAKFCLDYVAGSQSTVRFVSATNNFTIDNQGCFTLYTATNSTQGQFSQAQFRAIVTLNQRLLRGDIEEITIFLRKGSPTGETISDAVVVDTITINAGSKQPRLWAPLVRR